tara:strand:- start:66 stop:407 length:342 start_codon:yes stop_codon:yes gene_type:complete
MNYEAAGDFDINKAVAEALSLKISSDQYMGYGDRDENVVLLSVLSEGDKAVDYCNNPSDAWPIIVKNRISLEFIQSVHDGKRYCRAFISLNTWSSENPLRAAMIVFLKMKEQT